MSGTPIQYPLQLANGQQLIAIPGAPAGAQQIILACASYPSAGTVSVEYRLAGDALWRPVPKGTGLALSSPIVLATYGAVAAYRVTLAGITGGSSLSAWVAEVDAEGFPPGAFLGLRALTTQNYIEANVKNGVQYEVSSYIAALAAGANSDTVFITGALPVAIKTRIIGHDAQKVVEAHVFRAPTYTGGVTVPYYNLNLRNPVAGGVQILGGGTLNVSAPGTEVGAPNYSIGSSSLGQNTVGAYQTLGIERLLAPNTTYMLRIINGSAAACQLAAYISWYEGDTDLPV